MFHAVALLVIAWGGLEVALPGAVSVPPLSGGILLDALECSVTAPDSLRAAILGAVTVPPISS